MRWAKRIGIVFGVLLGLVLILSLSLLLYIGSSQSGAHRLFALVQTWVPGELSVDAIQGRLAGPLLIKGLRYRQKDGLAFENDILRLDWRPAALLKGRLEIIELGLSNTGLILPEGESETEPAEPFQGLDLPMGITVERFSSDLFKLTGAEGEEPVVIEHLDFRAASEGERLVISKLSFDGLSAKLELDGSVGLDESLPLALNLEWRYSLPEGVVLSGQGEIKGNAKKLRLHQEVAAPLSSVVDVDLMNLLETPSWQAVLLLNEAQLVEFAKEFPATLQGRLSARGDLDNATLEGAMRLTEPGLGEINSELAASYHSGKVRLTSLKLTNPQAVDIEGEGEYHIGEEELSFQLQWQGLRWPLNAEQESVRSNQGKLSVTGTLDQYDYRLAAGVSSSGLPPIEIDASGSGDLKTLELDRLHMVHQQSRIEGQGMVQWSPELNWRLTLTGDEFDPGLLHQEFPGQLAFQLSSEGQIEDEAPRVELLLETLEGTLRDYPVKAKGRLHYQQGVAIVEALDFHSGPNRITVKGELGEQLAMDWSMNAPELAGFWPGLTGKLNAEGKLQGEAEAPDMVMSLNGREIAFETSRIDRLDGKLNLELSGEQSIAFMLNGAGLAVEGKQWDALKVVVDGTLPKHKLSFDLSGSEVPRLSLSAEAGLDRANNWQGKLKQLTTASPELGAWHLAKPVEYKLGPLDQNLDHLCLLSDESRICGRYTKHNGEGWKAQLQVDDFRLQRLQAWLLEGARLKGDLALQADLSGSTEGELEGNLELTIPQAGLGFLFDKHEHQVDFSGTRLSAKLDSKGAVAQVNLPLQDLGGLNGDISLPGLKLTGMDPKQQSMKGEIRGSIENLAFISTLVPKLQNSRGKLDIDFSLGGMLGEPQLHGEARLSGGASDVPELGIELRDLALKVKAVDLDKLEITGEVRSGDGRLSLQGTTHLDADQGFPSEYKITGKEWLAVDLPEAEVQVSPDLVFKQQARGTELRGQIKVPYARLRPRELPKSAVSVSSDMVIAGDAGDDQAEKDIPLHAQIRLTLGKRVSFDGFGLRGNFTGNLLLIDEPGRPVLGRGRLGITDGVYQAYGQDLQIERGYALFADSPVDNPGVNVRAIREVDEVIAGLRVSGTLKNPKLNLFSTPTMIESDILTYLLTGRAPGESSGQTVGLAAALKASGASNLASELGRRFGLEELRVDTGSTLEEASLVAGTYLSPRLYVQYINELSTAETKLRMRYDLTDRWQLEAETGRTQAGDFFYTFER
jgi:translocation and assembly module TamB